MLLGGGDCVCLDSAIQFVQDLKIVIAFRAEQDLKDHRFLGFPVKIGRNRSLGVQGAGKHLTIEPGHLCFSSCLRVTNNKDPR